jgi:aspartyl/asparaginyl beta-hydroxylase (cupin superfamily)
MYIYILIIIIVIILFSILYYKTYYDIYDFSNLINIFFDKYCNQPAIFNSNDFQWTKKFRDNYQIIKNEYFTYSENNYIPLYKQLTKTVTWCDNRNKWRALYLRAFNVDTKLAKYFPKTMELINKIPCTLAFFSVLEPGAKLSPHVGIYKGVIRYHLGLKVPKEFHKCFINVDGKNLYWEEGKDIMFDDMFTHYVENDTNEERIVLFLDIKRDFNNIFLNSLNTILLYYIKSNDLLNDTVTNINKYSI